MAERPTSGPSAVALQELRNRYAGLVERARTAVAEGRDPGISALEHEIAAAAAATGSGPDIAALEERALGQLRGVAAVHRARTLVRAPPTAADSSHPPASGGTTSNGSTSHDSASQGSASQGSAPQGSTSRGSASRGSAIPQAARMPGHSSRRAPLRSRPTISANMEVRRGKGGPPTLEWDTTAAVTGWEVRFSERTDARGDYEVVETLALAAGVTAVGVPLSHNPLRIHLLGRTRGGRLLRRAVISGLTIDTWLERWQRRASAA